LFCSSDIGVDALGVVASDWEGGGMANYRAILELVLAGRSYVEIVDAGGARSARCLG